MHYYKRNLGDYAKKAGRLTILQHGVYNLLLDACYDRERFPTRDEAIEWTWASSAEEIAAVDFVLGRMFVLSPESGKYVQSRVAEEIAEYKKFCEKQALNGKSGGRPKKPNGSPEKPSGIPSQSVWHPKESLTTNQEPLTINQEPLTNTDKRTRSKPQLDYTGWPQQPDPQVLSDWLAMRKRLKADVSQTVVNSFAKELTLAVADGVTVDQCLSECITANWRGFKFGWLKNRDAGRGQPARQQPARHGEFENRDYQKGVSDDGRF